MPLWPFLVYLGAVAVIVLGMLSLSYVLGERHAERMTGEPYESGIVATGTARMRFDVRYYLIAMFFVIFDVESAILFAWAISARQAGWTGYVDAAIFIGVLFVALAYIWRLGALDWGMRRGRRPEA